ncbi:MAG: hypothetical protein JWO06_27 [Bacteroidota bacterium]|nr:hypothetical protein [Bacteroidota bacterium]
MKKIKDKEVVSAKDPNPARKKADSIESDTKKSAGLEDDGGLITGTGNNKSGTTGGRSKRR